MTADDVAGHLILAAEYVLDSGGSGRVQFLAQLIRLVKKLAPMRLIGQRPQDDARMSVIVINHRGRGRENCFEIAQIFRALKPAERRFRFTYNPCRSAASRNSCVQG